MTRRALYIAAAVLLVLVACGGSSKVGQGIDVNKLQKNGGTRLGERTSTTLPPATTAPPTTRSPATTRPVATTAPAQVSLEIKIQGAAPQFNPAVGQVRSGTTVRWTNADSQTRSVEADDGTFASPPIAPGGHWDLKAPGPGTYNYHDGTRPYAVGQLQVV